MSRRPDEEPRQECGQGLHGSADPTYVWGKDTEETPRSLGVDESWSAVSLSTNCALGGNTICTGAVGTTYAVVDSMAYNVGSITNPIYPCTPSPKVVDTAAALSYMAIISS
eukprot:11893557-Ditylum_brightwellii.AAC.1